MKKKKFVVPAVVAPMLFVCLGVMTDDVGAQEAEGKQEESFEQELWSYLEKVEYEENYSPWPGTKDEFLPGQAPHGAHLKLYVNRHVTKRPEDPPYKSIIIKENYTPEKELAAITIMYRVKDYDSENNDWYWVKYLPDGKVATQNGNKIAGKVMSCVNCHAGAQGDDYVFINDENSYGSAQEAK